VLAMAYDYPVPGFATNNCNSIRLWRAKPTSEFDLSNFSAGKYFEAIIEK